MHQEQESPVDKEQDVDEPEQVVGVPECIEACKSIERRGKPHNVPPKSMCGKSEGDAH